MNRQWAVLAISLLSIAVFAQASGIRSINFNEFSYRGGAPFCEEFGPVVKVHQGRAANKKATFEVSQVLYGNLANESGEDAAVVASCIPQGANGGFENNLVYIYGLQNGRVVLLALFVRGEPWNFTERVTEEPPRRDKLYLFDVVGVSIGYRSIEFDRTAGEARCCPLFSVKQRFVWNNGRFGFAGEERRPWKQK